MAMGSLLKMENKASEGKNPLDKTESFLSLKKAGVTASGLAGGKLALLGLELLMLLFQDDDDDGGCVISSYFFILLQQSLINEDR